MIVIYSLAKQGCLFTDACVIRDRSTNSGRIIHIYIYIYILYNVYNTHAYICMHTSYTFVYIHYTYTS